MSTDENPEDREPEPAPVTYRVDLRPKDMSQDELEALPAMSDMEAGLGAGVQGDDIIWFHDREGWRWRLQLGKNGWYKSTGIYPTAGHWCRVCKTGPLFSWERGSDGLCPACRKKEQL